MHPRFIGPDGFAVEAIYRTGASSPELDGGWYRITQHGYFHAEVRTIAELDAALPFPADLLAEDISTTTGRN